MSLSLLSTPIKTINGLLSNVNAGRSQLPFTFQRADFQSTGTGNSGGFWSFIIAGDVSTEFNVGDSILYVKDIDSPNYDEGIPDGIYVVQGIVVNATPLTYLQTDIPVASITYKTNTGFINNQTTRENYKVAIEIFDETATTKLIDRTFLFSPKPNGELFVDLAEIVTEYQEQNLIASLLFTVAFSEKWNGSDAIPQPAPDFTGTFGTSAQTTTGGNVRLQSVAPTTAPLSVGDWIFVSFDSVYPDGNYQIIQVPTAVVIDIDLPFISAGIAGTIEPAKSVAPPFTFTEPIQSIYAMKQLLDVGGSNMWQRLLRSGLQPDSQYLGGKMPNLPLIETNNNSTPWDIVEPDELFLTLSGVGTEYSNEIAIISEFVNDPIYPKGALIRYKFVFSYNVTDFVASGDLRIELYIRNATGGNAIIRAQTFANVSANQGFAEYTLEGEYTVPEDDMSRIRFRVGKITPTSNFTTIWKCQNNQFPQRFIEVNISEVGKLLTWFENPLMWRGWKRTASLLVDKEYQNRVPEQAGLKYGEYPSNINKQFISDQFLSGGFGFTTPYILQLTLKKEPTKENEYYNQVRFFNNNFSAEMAERLYFQWMDECQNPIMIQWLNSLGAFEQHMFAVNQTFRIESEQGLTGERTVDDDIENINRTKVRVPLTWKQQMIVEADNLTFDQLNALREIKESSLVSVWLDKDGAQQIYVVLNNNYSTDYDTGDGSFGITLQFEFPDNFDFFKAKKY